jgi:hypothetical protein
MKRKLVRLDRLELRAVVRFHDPISSEQNGGGQGVGENVAVPPGFLEGMAQNFQEASNFRWLRRVSPECKSLAPIHDRTAPALWPERRGCSDKLPVRLPQRFARPRAFRPGDLRFGRSFRFFGAAGRSTKPGAAPRGRAMDSERCSIIHCPAGPSWWSARYAPHITN